MIDSSKALRSIRSYVRRESRITLAQTRALQELWPRYGVPVGEALIDWPAVFGRRAPVILEIGFGNGDTLAATAAAHPQNDYLGIEVHRPGTGSLLRRLAAENLVNVRLMLGDAREIVPQRIPDASLDGVHLFFPDPWPKKRHHKRRLVQSDFAALVTCKLKARGYFHLATDWSEYAAQMKTVLSQTPGLADAEGSARFRELTGSRRATRFEQRGRRLGHEVWDLVYLRQA